MMDQVVPCASKTETLEFLLASLNVVQVVLLAYIGMRTKRKNDEDQRNGRHSIAAQ